MKKENIWGKIIGGTIFVMCCSLFMPSVGAQAASLRGKNNEEKIFYFLKENMEFNNAAGSGVLANIARESSFNPKAKGDNGTSYGICQWHAGRMDELKRWCKRNGYNYKKLDGQLNYLKFELTTDYYYSARVYTPIKAVPNSAKGAYKAAYIWCYYFEIPANKEQVAESRGNLAKKTYWKNYKKASIGLNVGKVYETEEGYFKAISENTVAFHKMTDQSVAALSIPDTVKIGDLKAKVVAISANACKGNDNLEQVTIGKNVIKIGKKAFYGCKNLKKVTIKSTKVTSFGSDSFNDIADKAVFTVPSKVKKDYAAKIKKVAPKTVKIKKK